MPAPSTDFFRAGAVKTCCGFSTTVKPICAAFSPAGGSTPACSCFSILRLGPAGPWESGRKAIRARRRGEGREGDGAGISSGPRTVGGDQSLLHLSSSPGSWQRLQRPRRSALGAQPTPATCCYSLAVTLQPLVGSCLLLDGSFSRGGETPPVSPRRPFRLLFAVAVVWSVGGADQPRRRGQASTVDDSPRLARPPTASITSPSLRGERHRRHRGIGPHHRRGKPKPEAVYCYC